MYFYTRPPWKSAYHDAVWARRVGNKIVCM